MTSDSQSAIQTALGGLLRVAVISAADLGGARLFCGGGGEANDWIDMAAALGCAAVLLRDFTGMLSLCRDTLRPDQRVFGHTSAGARHRTCDRRQHGDRNRSAGGNHGSVRPGDDTAGERPALFRRRAPILPSTAVDAAAGNGMLRGIADGIKSLTSGVLKLI